ncbi:MAG: DegT/DnrJ/EryC1/StrS family aminotransferase [Candidatus Nitrospinota bacterium M3_3B_026]
MDTIHMAGPWITEHEISTVEKAMRDWYENPYQYCELFQKEFAALVGRRHALMTPNCTTALHLLLAGMGVTKGDEVIVPECTWIATAAPVAYVGATPVFCDINGDDWCLDADSVERAITPRTRAVIAVDLFGNMPDMDRLQAVCERHGVPLIEDAAEAVGSKYRGARAGKFGIGSVFSFHRTKTIVTGEGGMLLLDDDDLYERCFFLRDHGRRSDGPMYYNYEVTFKYMPFNVQAALGYAQLQRVDDLVAKKRWVLDQYRRKLADVPDLSFNPEPPHVVNGAWITGLVFGRSHNMSKLKAMERLGEAGVPSRPFFYPLSSLPAYPGMREVYEPRNPVAYDVSSRGINLPGALTMTEEQVDFVAAGIRIILNHG